MRRSGGHETMRAAPTGRSSATTSAADLDERIWRPRRTLAVGLHLAAVAVPIGTAIVATSAAASVVDTPSNGALGVVRLIGLLGLSLLVAWTVGRLTRRLLPLAALYRMSLSFPGHAPARFQLALQRGTTRQLQRALLAGDLDHDTEQAATALLSLVSRLNGHDRLTRGHSERVRAYSVMIGQELGVPEPDLDRLQWAALLHDVGKIEVPSDILNKPGRPDDHEWAVLRDHPRNAEEMVDPVRPWLGEWVDAATQHHERVDGRGYPAGLRGDEITFGARIVAVADAFDTMTAVRSYKVPLPAGQARAELARSAGSQFDPDAVRALLSIGLPQLLWVAGPVAALAQVPGIGSVFTTGTNAVSSLGAAVASGAGQAAVAGSMVAVTGACVAAATTLGDDPVVITTASSDAPAAPDSAVEGETSASGRAIAASPARRPGGDPARSVLRDQADPPSAPDVTSGHEPSADSAIPTAATPAPTTTSTEPPHATDAPPAPATAAVEDPTPTSAAPPTEGEEVALVPSTTVPPAAGRHDTGSRAPSADPPAEAPSSSPTGPQVPAGSSSRPDTGPPEHAQHPGTPGPPEHAQHPGTPGPPEHAQHPGTPGPPEHARRPGTPEHAQHPGTPEHDRPAPIAEPAPGPARTPPSDRPDTAPPPRSSRPATAEVRQSEAPDPGAAPGRPHGTGRPDDQPTGPPPDRGGVEHPAPSRPGRGN